MASARAVGGRPVYLYVWPEYRQGGFLPAWDSETTGSQVASGTEWVNVVHDYQNGTL